MTKTYCDRCTAEIRPDKLQKWPLPIAHPDGWHARYLDLCPECMAVLAALLIIGTDQYADGRPAPLGEALGPSGEDGRDSAG